MKYDTDRLGQNEENGTKERAARAREFSGPPEPAQAMRHGQTQCLVQVSRSESENSASYAFLSSLDAPVVRRSPAVALGMKTRGKCSMYI